jgi:hypothetical protein
MILLPKINENTIDVDQYCSQTNGNEWHLNDEIAAIIGKWFNETPKVHLNVEDAEFWFTDTTNPHPNDTWSIRYSDIEEYEKLYSRIGEYLDGNPLSLQTQYGGGYDVRSNRQFSEKKLTNILIEVANSKLTDFKMVVDSHPGGKFLAFSKQLEGVTAHFIASPVHSTLYLK